MSPGEVLKAALNALTGVDFFEMEVEVRTLKNDSFSYINPECDFIKHNIMRLLRRPLLHSCRGIGEECADEHHQDYQVEKQCACNGIYAFGFAHDS